METIAFYSYTGDVSRSLVLVDAAWFLAERGERVVVLDLNFEAPCLHYWLRSDESAARDPSTSGGTAAYLAATAEGAVSPPPLEQHLLRVPPEAGALSLMPAGPAPDRTYWTALKELDERLDLDDPSGQGVMAVLDLQARIQDELKPDYLLLDIPPGITELGDLATTVLADSVVCIFFEDAVSLDGTVAVAEALKEAPRLEGRDPLRIVPVLVEGRSQRDRGRMQDTIPRLLELGEAKDRRGARATLFILPDPTEDRHRVLLVEKELFQRLFQGGANSQQLESLETR